MKFFAHLSFPCSIKKLCFIPLISIILFGCDKEKKYAFEAKKDSIVTAGIEPKKTDRNFSTSQEFFEDEFIRAFINFFYVSGGEFNTPDDLFTVGDLYDPAFEINPIPNDFGPLRSDGPILNFDDLVRTGVDPETMDYFTNALYPAYVCISRELFGSSLNEVVGLHDNDQAWMQLYAMRESRADDGNGGLAYSGGTILLALNYLEKLAKLSSNGPDGNAAALAIFLHEMAHILQYVRMTEQEMSKIEKRKVELHADFLTGWMLNYLVQRECIPTFDVLFVSSFFYSIGDPEQRIHGHPVDRALAFRNGYNFRSNQIRFRSDNFNWKNSDNDDLIDPDNIRMLAAEAVGALQIMEVSSLGRYFVKETGFDLVEVSTDVLFSFSPEIKYWFVP